MQECWNLLYPNGISLLTLIHNDFYFFVIAPGVSSTALSLVNEAQYLMINHASVDLLQRHITSRYSITCYYAYGPHTFLVEHIWNL